MDYARLITDAWTITWRHKFLWILALFAGGSAGSCSGSSGFNFNFPAQWTTGGRDGGGYDGGYPPISPDIVTSWISSNLVVIIIVGVTLLLLGILWLIISLIAEGGMAHATAELGMGRPSTLGSAWHAGVRLFWRYFGLWLILVALGIVIALFFVGLGVGVVAIVSMIGTEGRLVATIAVIIVAVFIGIVAALILIVASILFNILLAYAQRAIAVEDIGPVAALRGGWGLLRAYFGRSLLVWLINVGIGIAVGLVMLLVVLVVAVPLGALGVFIYLAVGFGAPVIVYAVIAALVFIVITWLISAVVNTYFWSYWTLAYLRLTGRVEPVV